MYEYNLTYYSINEYKMEKTSHHILLQISEVRFSDKLLVPI